MKRMIAALVLAATLALPGISAAQPASMSYWGCTTYIFWYYFAYYEVVASYEDPSNTSFLHWPYSTVCVWLYQCDTVFEDGVYTTTCG